MFYRSLFQLCSEKEKKPFECKIFRTLKSEQESLASFFTEQSEVRKIRARSSYVGGMCVQVDVYFIQKGFGIRRSKF